MSDASVKSTMNARLPAPTLRLPFAVLLFLNGEMPAVDDAARVEWMTPLGGERTRWQVLGLSGALPLVCAGFIALSITKGQRATQA